jgi:hypothetical protein
MVVLSIWIQSSEIAKAGEERVMNAAVSRRFCT